jgi:hypothetical protein
MDAASAALLDKVLATEEGEEVLIVINSDVQLFTIASSIREHCLARGTTPVIIAQEKKGSFDYCERFVLEAMKASPDVFIILLKNKLGKDREGIERGYTGKDNKTYNHILNKLIFGDKVSRGAWSPGITPSVYSRCMPANYDEIARRGENLKTILDESSAVHITSPHGTDITVALGNRYVHVEAGNLRTPGCGGNIPLGEVCMSPELGVSQGVFVADGTIALPEGSIVPETPVTITVEKGKVKKVEGGEDAERMNKAIKKAEKFAEGEKIQDALHNVRNIGELGIGLNEQATISGNIIEDEKVLGTLHLAVGSNIDGDAPSVVHIDCVLFCPTMETNTGTMILKDGKLLI